MKHIQVKICNQPEESSSFKKDYLEGAIKAIFIEAGVTEFDEKTQAKIKAVANAIRDITDDISALDMVSKIQSCLINVNDSDTEENEELDNSPAGMCPDECPAQHCKFNEVIVTPCDYIEATKTFNEMFEYFATSDEEGLTEIYITDFVKAMETFNKLYHFYLNH